MRNHRRCRLRDADTEGREGNRTDRTVTTGATKRMKKFRFKRCFRSWNVPRHIRGRRGRGHTTARGASSSRYRFQSVFTVTNKTGARVRSLARITSYTFCNQRLLGGGDHRLLPLKRPRLGNYESARISAAVHGAPNRTSNEHA